MGKTQRITIGAILEIYVEGYYSYAQILGKANYAVFDFKSKEKIKEFSILLEIPVLFIVSVYNDAVTNGHWLKVGKIPVREDLQNLPLKFIQDSIDPDRFEFYDPNTGDIKPAQKNQIKGLERAAVWEARHVEDRIRDYYNGNPCKWLREDEALFEE